MKHSPEPWRIADFIGDAADEKPEKYWECSIFHANRKAVCWGEQEMGSHNFTNPDDAERIVACVNACSGIPSRFLEEFITQSLSKWKDEYEYTFDWIRQALEMRK